MTTTEVADLIEQYLTTHDPALGQTWFFSLPFQPSPTQQEQIIQLMRQRGIEVNFNNLSYPRGFATATKL